jgi:hypothetical protein
MPSRFLLLLFFFHVAACCRYRFKEHEMTKQKEWADIPKEFHNWWDADRLTQTNPFREDSPAYWAWEGWQARAALEQPEQEPGWLARAIEAALKERNV